MNTIKTIKPFKVTISQKYHEFTKIKEAIKDTPVEKWPETWKKVYFKGYPRFEAIKLPEPDIPKSLSYKEVLYKRQSGRNFSNPPINLQELSNLLFFTGGIRKRNETWVANRFYPSAGARYPLEIYPIIFNVKGVKPGVYHYYLKNHLLEILPKKQKYKQSSLKWFGNPWAKRSNLLLVISSVFFRTKVKYGERGYRHVLTELGCLIQNIYLTCAALNLGCCPTGGYNDDGYNFLLDLDGLEESVIGVVAIGRRI